MKWLAFLWHGRINSIQFMARIGYGILVILAVSLYLHYQHPIKLGNMDNLGNASFSEMMKMLKEYGTAIANITTIYSYRFNFVGLYAVFFTIIGFLYFKRMQDINIPTIISLIPVLIMWGSFVLVAHKLIIVFQAIDFNTDYVGKIIMFAIKPNAAIAEVLKFPLLIEQIIATKIPLYLFMSSLYFILITGTFAKSQTPVNRYGNARTPRRCHYYFTLLFTITFIIFTYHVITKLLINNPYEHVEIMAEYLSILK